MRRLYRAGSKACFSRGARRQGTPRLQGRSGASWDEPGRQGGGRAVSATKVRMFYAPNRLAELVRRPGGKPRQAAIADAARNVEARKDFLFEGIRDGVLSIE